LRGRCPRVFRISWKTPCIRGNLLGGPRSFKKAANLMDRDGEDLILSSLEKRIQALETRVRKLEGSDGDEWLVPDFETEENVPVYGHYEIYGISEINQAPQGEIKPIKIHPSAGRPISMSPEKFEKRRDWMIFWVESLWPELESVIKERYVEPQTLGVALSDRFPNRDGDASFQRILRNVGALWEFLQDHSEPLARHLACAMAGVPELSWTTSLGRCDPSQEPSRLEIHFRAMKNHIQKRHRKWYGLLVKQGLTPQTAKMIPRDCSDCARFIKRPDRIMNAINIEPLPKSGRPSNAPVVISE
jgi:hypothetical protein